MPLPLRCRAHRGLDTKQPASGGYLLANRSMTLASVHQQDVVRHLLIFDTCEELTVGNCYRTRFSILLLPINFYTRPLLIQERLQNTQVSV